MGKISRHVKYRLNPQITLSIELRILGQYAGPLKPEQFKGGGGNNLPFRTFSFQIPWNTNLSPSFSDLPTALDYEKGIKSSHSLNLDRKCGWREVKIF